MILLSSSHRFGFWQRRNARDPVPALCSSSSLMLYPVVAYAIYLSLLRSAFALSPYPEEGRGIIIMLVVAGIQSAAEAAERSLSTFQWSDRCIGVRLGCHTPRYAWNMAVNRCGP